MKPNRSIPSATVVPVLIYPDVRAAVAWLQAAFGFRERVKIGEDHRAQMRVGEDGAVILGDGFVTTSPDKDAIEQYRSGGGKGPVHAGTKVCFMDSEEEARKTVHRLWPNEALPGELAQILPTPSHFEQACELVTPDLLSPPMGPDLDAHAATLREYADAGVDELFVQQIGPAQDAFFSTWAKEILPRFR